MKKHNIILVGTGLSSLITACCLIENGKKDIAIVYSGFGGTPYIAAFNAVLPDSPFNDSARLYTDDMYKAGFELGDKDLIDYFGELSVPVVKLLERWGVQFAPGKDYKYLLRRCSGSSCPRSLCRTDMTIGQHMVDVLMAKLKEKGVIFYDSTEVVSLLTKNNEIIGVTIKQDEWVYNLYSKCVVLGWGGIGNLYKDTTYPADIDGRTLAMAYDAGAKLVDLEFVEFEPMVCLRPEGLKGEPCPTAMLGEGGYLLNTKGERFLLKLRPEGEAGAPKTLINNAISKEVAEGRGNQEGGVFADLRHLDENVIKAYPWFYNRMINNGVNPKTDLISVGPVAHSHSGGIMINKECESHIKGLYAIGEAAGGMHGACRMAGNACTQAAVSGYAAGLAIAKKEIKDYDGSEESVEYNENESIFSEYAPKIRNIVWDYVNKHRCEEGLAKAEAELKDIIEKTKEDTKASQLALSALLLVTAARARTETRGTHNRDDFSKADIELYRIEIEKGEFGIKAEKKTKEA